jgi:hypothetical protein
MTRTLTLTACLLALAFAACGGDDPTAPTEIEAADVNAAIERVVTSCTSGDVEGYAQNERRKDVARLIEIYRGSDPDARFQLVEGAESTTMRELLSSAHAVLAGVGNSTCSGEAADELTAALEG